MDRFHNICSEDNLDAILNFNCPVFSSSSDVLQEKTQLKTVCDENYVPSTFNQIKENKTNDSSLPDDGFPLKNELIDSQNHFTSFQSRNALSQNIFSERCDLSSGFITAFTWDIPESISNLLHTVRGNLSDFSFVYLISSQLCQEIMPMECYVEFKMGLLLSLASIQSDSKIPPLPIIGIGQDTSLANLLMIQVSNLANRFITSIDKSQSAVFKHENTVEAGPLLLANSGVYYLGDWSRLNETVRSKLLRDINCGYVSVDDTTITFPLNTAVWCYWKNYKNNKNDMRSLATFLKVFGIPFILQESSVEKLTNFLLSQAMSNNYIHPKDDLSVSSEDMRKYLRIVSNRKVNIPSQCEELLKNYFIASRLDRPECLTETAYLSLKKMSESFAKLSCRECVTHTDIIGAIYLSEHFIKHVFGPGVFPPPIEPAGNNMENVEIMFNNFEKWFYVYLSRFTPTPMLVT